MFMRGLKQSKTQTWMYILNYFGWL